MPAKIGGTKGATGGNVDEFDLLAKSRTVEVGTAKKDTTDMTTQQTEFDEMAEWLKNNVSAGLYAAAYISFSMNIPISSSVKSNN